MQIKNYNQLDLVKIIRKVNLIIPAQTAKLGPPVGPVLGQVKIKVKDFCTMFNEATLDKKYGLPLPVEVFVYKNEVFNFYIKTPTARFLLKNLILYKKVENLNLLDIYKIALIKQVDLPHLSLRAIFSSILITVKILKIKINF